MLEVIRCVLLCMLEGRLCLLEVLEMMRRVLLWMLEAMAGEVCLLEVFEVLKVLDVLVVMRCILLCMLEAVEDGLSRDFEISSVEVFSLQSAAG